MPVNSLVDIFMTALEPRQFRFNRDHLVIPRSSDYVIDLVGYGYLFKASSAQILSTVIQLRVSYYTVCYSH